MFKSVVLSAANESMKTLNFTCFVLVHDEAGLVWSFDDGE